MRSHVLLSLAALVLAAQLCCCCGAISGPEPPYAVVPSDDAVEQFKERWDAATDAGPDGSFSVTVTEQEMTSLIVQQLERQENPPPVSDLQVHLRDNRIEVYATVTMNDALPVPGMVALSAAAVDGNVNVTVEEIAFGPLPIPDSVLETATGTLNDLIRQSVLDEMGQVTVNDIQIGEGEMTLSGKISPTAP